MTPLILILPALCSPGCERAAPPVPQPEVCTVVAAARPLPRDVRETSGLARSGLADGVFWTHNDKGNSPDLFAVDANGTLLSRTRVTGATNVDWEDIETARCDAGTCIYIGDIGDNDVVRTSITIYEVQEPVAGAESTAPARAHELRYPDGPHNAEALFVLGRDFYIVTKNEGPAILYRHRMGGADVLERVREIDTGATGRDALVTGATVTPDGNWVAIRTYTRILFYPANELVNGTDATPLTFDLRELRETQGEGIAFGADGTVWLSSEAEDDGAPRLSRLRCELTP